MRGEILKYQTLNLEELARSKTFLYVRKLKFLMRHFSTLDNSQFLRYKIMSTKSDVLKGMNVKTEVFWNVCYM
jgi:hypothetical protein